MSNRSNKKSEPSTNYTPQPVIFAQFNGVKKRKIFYNVDFTEDEEGWIKSVRKELKEQKGIEIHSDQVILRFFYSADFKMQKCVEKLYEYNLWFTNPSIQCLTANTFQIFKDGFSYSYGKALDGRPFIIMNISVLEIDKYTVDNYYQAINYPINKAMKDLIPGYMESYYYMIDLNEQLLRLPFGLLGDVIKKIGNAYTGVLEKLFIINCTTISKWIYNRLRGFGIISEQSGSRTFFYTHEDLMNGELKNLISQDVLEEKYGGRRANIDHRNDPVYKNEERARVLEFDHEQNETEYFSIEQFEHTQFKDSACCGGVDQCSIY